MVKRFGGLTLTFKVNSIEEKSFFVGSDYLEICEARKGYVKLKVKKGFEEIEIGKPLRLGQAVISLVESGPNNVRLNFKAPLSVLIDRKAVRTDKVKAAASGKQLAEVSSRK